MSASCQSCAAPIEWALTHAGRNMPLDATPSAETTSLIAWRDGNNRLQVRDVDGVGASDAPSDARHATSHFQTCPNAAQHRKKRKSQRPTSQLVDVDGTPVRVCGRGEPTELDRQAVAEFAAELKRSAEQEGLL